MTQTDVSDNSKLRQYRVSQHAPLDHFNIRDSSSAMSYGTVVFLFKLVAVRSQATKLDSDPKRLERTIRLACNKAKLRFFHSHPTLRECLPRRYFTTATTHTRAQSAMTPDVASHIVSRAFPPQQHLQHHHPWHHLFPMQHIP